MTNPTGGQGAPEPLWRIREGVLADVPAVAEVHRRSMRDAMPWLPMLHTPAEDLSYFTRQLESGLCWVAVGDAAVVAYAVVYDDWVGHLYVDTPWQGLGIGSALLELAKTEIGPGLQLWAFQRNARARQFYAQHGLVEVEFTDGQGNEEREPDVRLQWR